MDIPRQKSDRVWRRTLAVAGAALGLLALTAALASSYGRREETPGPAAVQYDESGALLYPGDYRKWVFVGASTGLIYTENRRRGSGPGMFHNVYLNPAAYKHFAETGEFPEKTLLALAMYRPSQKDDLVRGGFFEGEFVALEFALKDGDRFADGWGYFNFSRDGRRLEKASPESSGSCNSCHRQHGAQDNVFLQFYPVLRRLQRSR